MSLNARVINFVLGADAAGGVFRATRDANGWEVAAISGSESLDGQTTFIFPNEPAWRAWVEPSELDVVYEAADARAVTWDASEPIVSLLPPFDFRDLTPFQSFPEGCSPAGLNFAVELHASNAPGGTLTGLMYWRDGALAEVHGCVPDELRSKVVLRITAPLINMIKYLDNQTTIYSVISEGAEINGDPWVLQFFAGYLELDAFKNAADPHQRAIRSALADFLEFHERLTVVPVQPAAGNDRRGTV